MRLHRARGFFLGGGLNVHALVQVADALVEALGALQQVDQAEGQVLDGGGFAALQAQAVVLGAGGLGGPSRLP